MAVRQLRSVDAGFAESAPLRLVFSGEMSTPPGAVYRALAEETEAWPRWFTPATAARQTPMPGPPAGPEDWRLTPAGTGTRVSWTFAADGSKPFFFYLRAFRPGMARAFTVSLRRLTWATYTGQTPVRRKSSIVPVYGAMSMPCAASQSSE
ncbi:SRPBCC family protein [Streptomyces sp. NBC_01716]|uniref:SRPBCC family protein n=1 Tax=Streptomyces sp. NBC_01716 TaxID=2975917 RepID=UPI002E334233|nr:SRPBCC family protein [Streptomyces sp. NBC_01716]